MTRNNSHCFRAGLALTTQLLLLGAVIITTGCHPVDRGLPADWPLSCAQPSFDVAPELLQHCANRDSRGELVVNPAVLGATGHTSQVESLLIGHQWVFLNQATALAALTYDNGPDYFQEDRARFTRDNRVGFINPSLEVVIDPVWDFAFPFEKGTAVVCLDCKEVQDGEHSSLEGGKWGYIDLNGEILVEPVHLRDALPSPSVH